MNQKKAFTATTTFTGTNMVNPPAGRARAAWRQWWGYEKTTEQKLVDPMLSKLRACTAMPRGERLAAWMAASKHAQYRRALSNRLWRNIWYDFRPVYSAFWWEPEDVRAYAAPLRRAREQRQKLRNDVRYILAEIEREPDQDFAASRLRALLWEPKTKPDGDAE